MRLALKESPTVFGGEADGINMSNETKVEALGVEPSGDIDSIDVRIQVTVDGFAYTGAVTLTDVGGTTWATVGDPRCWASSLVIHGAIESGECAGTLAMVQQVAAAAIEESEAGDV